MMHEVSTFNGGKQLQEVVESRNLKWKVQLRAAISADDARAIDGKPPNTQRSYNVVSRL